MEPVQPLCLWTRVPWLAGGAVRVGKARTRRERGVLAAEPGGEPGLGMLSTPGRGLFPPYSLGEDVLFPTVARAG